MSSQPSTILILHHPAPENLAGRRNTVFLNRFNHTANAYQFLRLPDFLLLITNPEAIEMWDTLSWILFFFILIAILVIVVFQLMCFADLEFDYLNPYDSASRINSVIIPEFITQAALCLLYLVTGHWIMFILSVPCFCYNMRLYARRQHLVDVTEIFNQLDGAKRERLFKLGHLISLLFITLFWMIYNALEDDEM